MRDILLPLVKFWSVFCLAVGLGAELHGALPAVSDVEAQPLFAQVRRLRQALNNAGEPLSQNQADALEVASKLADGAAVLAVQEALDPLCLALVHINPEGRVKAESGPAPRELVQAGWRVFLVKVHNEAGVTAPLRCVSPQAQAVYQRSSGSPDPQVTVRSEDVRDRWCDVAMLDAKPLEPTLSGLTLEYRLLALYSRDAGKREASLSFALGESGQDLGSRSDVSLLFDCQPAVEVQLEVLDDDGAPTCGQFVIRDQQGRTLPTLSKRLAPDFYFHPQIYRHSGESVDLPPGKYDVRFTRGPEYLVQRRTITVPHLEKHREQFRLKRWIKLADRGWYSGDHHVHAAGCSHYESPSEGVTPDVMLRHIMGEDLNVGCMLSWGPCWYAQKKFFDGRVHGLSQPNHLMRYDVEVSGFPSSHAGHVCLLRLTEDDYPGAEKLEEWPSWTLPVLKWAKDQGGVVGYAHSGWGLAVEDSQLPSYQMPAFDGIGANEYIVTVTQGVCDFISAVDTPIVWELSIWYHTLNCGYQTRISGETDFPCIYDARVGLGRTYVKLEPGEPLSFDAWVAKLRDGRSYVSDGLTHLCDFTINGFGVGQKGDGGRASVLAIKHGEPLKVAVSVAALLEEQPRQDIRELRLDQKPYWNVERARINDSRTVMVELIVNGQAAAQKSVVADGRIQPVEFEYLPEHSSWLAVRILAAAHTNPIFVEVDGQPIRASRKSARWCLEAVDACWKQKSKAIRADEQTAAVEAYDAARAAYRAILVECVAD